MTILPYSIEPDTTGPCNGDYIVRSATGRLIALVYAGLGKHGEAVAKWRAQTIASALTEAWCDTCGDDTPGTGECETCAAWWQDNGPREGGAA